MSCELKKIFSFENYDKLINQIFIPQATDINWSSTTDLFETSSNVSQDSKEVENIEDIPNKDMIDNCLMAISSFGSIIVFAYRDNFSLFKFKDNTNPQLSFSGILDGIHQGESITAISCVPFVSHQKSNQGAPDWTCIILGFNSGMIRIYTENMNLLLEQKLHDEPITCIKVCSFYSPYLSGRTLQINSLENADEIFFCLKSIVIICEGYAFYQILRSCRNNLTRTSSYGFSLKTPASDFSLPLKKFSFLNSQQVQDCDNCGIHEFNFYDKLVNYSMTRGPYGHSKSKSMSGYFFISSGQDPFIGLHKADETESRSVLDEISQVVVSKLKNILPLFGKNNEKVVSKVDLPIDFSYNFGFYDQYRCGGKICLSPNRELAAVCDEFGRVCLVNVIDQLVVRMWKGYRDAQCGWIESFENLTQANSKRVLFLSIYTPKRGLLEIWRCQQGPRVGAFNVGKMCKLIYVNHSLLGLNRFIVDQFRNSSNHFPYSFVCYLFDFKKGSLFSIQVPFLCSLTEKHSQEARDCLILKEFQNLAKNSQNLHLAIFEKIQNPEVKWEAIKILIDKSEINIIKLITSKIVKSLSSQFDGKPETCLYILALNSYRVLKLCELFEYLKSFNLNISPLLISQAIHTNPPSDLNSVANKLKWKANDLARCISLFSFAESLIKEEETYKSVSDITLSHFIDLFLIVDGPNFTRQSNFEDIFDSFIYLKKSDSSYKIEDFVKLGEYILLSGLTCDNLDKFLLHLKESRIEHSLILFSLFAFWLESNLSNDWMYWIKFFNLIEGVLNLMKSSKNSIIHRDNDYLSFIKHLCNIIRLSSHLGSALVAAFILKTIYFDLDENLSKSKTDLSCKKHLDFDCSDEWEDLSIEKENINLLLTQIEHTFLLDTVLKTNRDKFCKKISLNFLLNHNSGIVSELVAEWVVLYPISASVILSSEDFQEEDKEEKRNPGLDIELGIDVCQTSLDSKLDDETLKQLIRHLRRCFPYSLEGEVILVNSAWESLIQWDKNPSIKSSCYLQSSLTYLSSVANSFLRHNLGCLMWKTFVVKRFETLALLIEKMGKTPKDRICKKDLGMGEEVLDIFVKFASDLLNLLLESLGMAETEGLPLFRVDDWWRDKNYTSSHPLLVHLVIQQSPGNSDLLLELHHLSLILYLIVNFQIKNSKPLSLFSTDVKLNMFKNLQTKIPTITKEVHILEKRLQFLLNAITMIAQSVPSSTKLKEEESDFNSRLHLVANQWFGKIILLGREWDLSLDKLRRKYLYELYKNGSDLLANEMIHTIQDRLSLGEKLLKVVGLRILSLIEKDRVNYISLMSPNVFHWLESLKQANELPVDVDVANTLILMDYIITFLPENKTSSRIAYSLYTILKQLSCK